MNDFIIIDGHSLAYRAYYGVPALSNSQGVVTNAVYGFLNMIVKLFEEEQPRYVAVAFDAGAKVFRNEQYEAYKANRKPMPDDLRHQIELIREALSLMNIPTVSLDGYEGDDVIGTLTKEASAEGLTSVIVTGDRDTFQLVDDRTSVYYTKRGLSEIDIVDPEHLQNTYDLTPAQVIDLKGLMGDASDNIPGVPGIGIKTAHKFLDKYGSMDELYNHIGDFAGKKMGAKLSEFKEQAYLSRMLATIRRDVPLEIGLESCKCAEPDIEGLRDFYNRLELRTLLNQLEQRYGLAESADEAPDGKVLEDFAAIEAWSHDLEPGIFSMIVHFDAAYKQIDIIDVRVHEKDNFRLLCGDNWQEVMALFVPILEHDDTQILTDDAKKLARAFYLAGVDPSSIAWDAELTDYLLMPEERDHSLDAQLVNKWGIVFPDDENEAAFLRLKTLEETQPKIMSQMREQELWHLYTNIELPLSFILAEMELDGVSVNVEYLQELQEEFAERLQIIQDGIYVTAGQEFNLNSPKQLGKVLFEDMGLPVIKKTKTGYSTSAEVLDALKEEHGIVQDILDYRQISKLKSTYVDGLLGLTDAIGKVHTTFNQTLTATGRLSSSEPNLQNIPVRTDEGRRIRQAFVPSGTGQVLISADYSQIELRVLAHMSMDDRLIQSFIDKEDIHRRTASEVFHIPIEDVTSAERRAAKAVNFGIIYGQTDYGLARELGIGRKEAQDYIDRYFERYPGVRAWLDKSIDEAREVGFVKTLFGRRRHIRDIHSKNFNLRSFAERTAVNTPIQGSAADIIKLAMIECDQRLNDEGFTARMILQVHDELIFEAPPEETGYLIQHVRNAMESIVKLNVPLKVDVKVGFNWQEMEDIT